MKYDLRMVMRRAWEIKKENRDNIFGLCLKMAWREVKDLLSYALTSLKAPKALKKEEMPELKGTEKQVAWAKKIRNEIGSYCIYYIKKSLNGRPLKALFSTKYINHEIDEVYESMVNGGSEEKYAIKHRGWRKDFWVKNIEMYNRFYDMFTKNDSAVFWINNRISFNSTNQVNLERYLDGEYEF